MQLIAEHRVGGRELRLVRGDITERDTEAIVNAANTRLQHGGGVAGAIVRKGGQVIQDESDAIGYVPVGGAAITGAGRLQASYVIHAVGPRMGEGDEDRKLTSAVTACLQLASGKKITSISLPAISSGIFGFPKDRCARILVTTARDYLAGNPDSSLKSVEFCIHDDETMKFFRDEFERLKEG